MGFSAPTSRSKDAYIWRILLIEDDEDDFIIVRGMLANARQDKFTLEWASTYDEGRKTLQSDSTFDAVLVDYYMAGRKGTDLIREVTQQGYPAPILLLTGRGTYEIDVEAMESGAADYLSKGEINAILLERALRYAIERKRNEVALSESQAELRYALARADWMARFPLENPNPVLRVSYEGLTLFCNDAGKQVLGAVCQEDEPVLPPIRTLVERAMEAGRVVMEDVALGEAVYTFNAIPIDDQRYVNLYGSNVTERHQFEQAQRESEAKFARAFQSSPTGITITRMADGLIIDANLAFLQTVGYERAEVLGQTSVTLGFHQSAETRAEVLREISEHGGVRNREIEVRTKSGKMLQLLFSAEIVEIGGEPSLLTTFLDITEIRRLEAERIAAAADMEVQRRLLTQREVERQVIARELHDGPIQTLASTTFHLQLIKESFPDPGLAESINEIGVNIRQTIRELREMLNDLRPPALMHFGLSKVIQMYNADFKERHPELEITVEIDDKGLRLPDQTGLALFRIYQEGLNNIVRHSGADRVRVAFTLQDNQFHLELRDNGRGFSTANDLSLLTSEGRFGLAGMKERAEAVGGELVVTSAPGAGTVIQVRGTVKVPGG